MRNEIGGGSSHRRVDGAFWILGLAAALVLATAVVQAQPVPDRDTLLLVQFDGSVDADYSLGTPTALSGGALADTNGGRFGGGADLAAGEQIALVGDDGNFQPAEGTIDFWIKPHWPGNDPETRRLVSLAMGDKQYLTVNTLGRGRLGFAVAAGEGDEWKWSRADADVSDWLPDSWHYVAFTWGDGQMRVYADGKEGVRSATDARFPALPPEEISLLGGDAVIDALRISKRMVTADDVRRAIDEADHPPYRYLSDLDWSPRAAVALGERRLLGDVRIPLVLGGQHSAKAMGLPAGAGVSAELKEPYGTLVGKVGVSALSRAGVAMSFEVWGDGRRLFESPPRIAAEPPLEIEVPLEGVKTLKLLGRIADSAEHSNNVGHGVWLAALVRPGADVEAMLSGKTLKPAEIEMYRRQEGADDYAFEPPAKGPFFVAAKYWEDEIDPAAAPSSEDIGRPLAAFAALGEYEPINWTVYAVEDLEDVAVELSDLRCGDSVLPRQALDVRIVLRGLMRDVYSLPPERSSVVSRFLLANRRLDVPAGTLREYHAIVHVPEDAAPGTYSGTARIAPANHPPQEVPVTLEVLPFRLADPVHLADKAYGVYYRFPPAGEDWSRVEVELADIREHGATMLKSNLGVDYELVDGRVEPSFDALMRGLKLLSRHGFRGPLPVSTGCEQAARLLEYDPVADYEDRQARERFYAVVKEAMLALKGLEDVWPHFEFLPTHMDEVFGRDRLERYIRLTEAVRQVPSLRVYITLHNDPGRDVIDTMRQCDPYVDVRCYNGHCMDSWYRVQGSFDPLRQELEAAGDEAWIYHNIRGSFFKAEWTRLVNGYYLWISPLKVHVPWMYYSIKGNPFDATDGPRLKGGDFAYAVPDPDDPSRIVPTRHWEAFREGVDDVRYLQTLEAFVDERAGSREAEAAQAWLDNLRRGVTPTKEQLQPIEKESPLLVFLSQKLDGPLYRSIRRQAAEHVLRLAAGDQGPRVRD